jgi:hypothetical protein
MSGDGAAPELELVHEAKRNRRSFLTAFAGGLSAIGLRALVSPKPARAANGSPLLIGTRNSGTTTTDLDGAGFEVTNAVGAAIYGQGDAVGVQGYNRAGQGWESPGVWGVAARDLGVGVSGFAQGNSGIGVYGTTMDTSENGIGVFGQTYVTTSETYGVCGQTRGSLGRGVFGRSEAQSGGTGVWGQSDGADGVGVRGYAWDNGTGQFGSGVIGTSGSTAFPPPPPIADTGVFGVSVSPSGGATAAGVVGDSDTNAGVAGFSSSPSHAAGEFQHAAGGVALNVQGPAQFAQSGLVSIAAGQKTATVMGVSLRSTSLVLATVQNNAGVAVQNALPNVTGSKITINLNKAVLSGKTAKVAWFVLN